MSCSQVIFNCHNQSEWYQPSLCYFNAFIALLIIPFYSLFGRGYACQIITLSLGYYKPVSEFPLVLSEIIHTIILTAVIPFLSLLTKKIVYKLNYWLTDLLTVALLWSSQYSWVSFSRVLLTVSEAESMVDIGYGGCLVSSVMCYSLAPERFPSLVQPHPT